MCYKLNYNNKNIDIFSVISQVRFEKSKIYVILSLRNKDRKIIFNTLSPYNNP